MRRREEGDLVGHSDDHEQRALAHHLLGDDLTRLSDSLRQLGSLFPASGSGRRQIEAALAVTERAARTLERIGGGHRPAREPTRLAVLSEQVVRSHDPESVESTAMSPRSS